MDDSSELNLVVKILVTSLVSTVHRLISLKYIHLQAFFLFGTKTIEVAAKPCGDHLQKNQSLIYTSFCIIS